MNHIQNATEKGDASYEQKKNIGAQHLYHPDDFHHHLAVGQAEHGGVAETECAFDHNDIF